MKIETDWQSTPALWMAYDADTADGAPDSHPSAHLRGFGRTKEDAINDFVEQHGEQRYRDGREDGTK